MRFYFEISSAQLKVFSAICSNFVVVWLVAGFTTKDLLVLTRDILAATISLYLAVVIEEILENYES